MTPVIIGNATLYFRDARMVELADGCAHMVFTDPPYGHNNNDGDLIHLREQALGRPLANGSDPRPIANDGAVEANDLAQWLFRESARWLRHGGCCCCCCCCGGGGPDPQFARWSLWMDGPLDFKQMVVWDKGPMGMGWHYRRSYETVLVGQKRGAVCKWYDETNRVENIIRPSQNGIKKIIPRADDHPTAKPPFLAAHFARLHTRHGEVVLDPFMGRGSTAEGVLPMGRKFIGIEIDRGHFDIACERIENAQRQQGLFA